MYAQTTIRIRLDPTPAQVTAFTQVAGCCRLVYNCGLEQRSAFWRQHKRATGFSFNWMGQKAELPAMKEAAPFLSDVPAHCLQMALQDLQKAYDNFFAGRAGYPKLRRKYEHDSFRFPDHKQIRIDLKAGLLILPKFGRKIDDNGAIFHRQMRGKIRSVTVTREGRNWYAAIQVQIKVKAHTAVQAELTAEDVFGVDRGVIVPYMGSDGIARGHAIDPPATSGRAKRFKRLQQSLARAVKGSRRRKKIRLKIAMHKAKDARRRRDMIEQVTTELAKNHRVIVIERLRVLSMTASAKGTLADPSRNVAAKSGLNRGILDKGWGMFRVRLAQKLAACGGHEDHADINAALVIRERGLHVLGLANPDAKIMLLRLE